MNDRSSLDSLGRAGTSARYSGCLAWASIPGFPRRRLLARSDVVLASSRDSLQGTFEKIDFQRLLCQQPLQFIDFLLPFPALDSRRFPARVRFHPFTPLVQQRAINPQFLRKRRHIGAALEPLQSLGAQFLRVFPISTRSLFWNHFAVSFLPKCHRHLSQIRGSLHMCPVLPISDSPFPRSTTIQLTPSLHSHWIPP